MSGGINLNIVSQAALAFGTGGTSLFAQIGMQIVSQIAKDVIQQVGSQLGLPQPAIDAAQGAFSAASGNYADAAAEYSQAAGGSVALAGNIGASLGGSPAEIGDLQRQVSDVLDQLVETTNKKMVDGENQEGGGVSGARGRRPGESFLMALARIMGQVIDDKMDQQMQAAQDLDQANQSGDKSHISEMSAKIQALGQEVSMLSNALNNSIKSLGEAATTLARKS
ncbi:hypothetical protein HL653_21000 [Sphingomonas sp. AP4-R1]|uniref:hypothetical protein n=1 Tax=Sphingomonas sp. AP4-R1 TaxID=2735134 RepID=UPI001493DB59|nr:hypothetical protein [Sphingomonas sp. AP4-R1]QJU59891.1 hypothetical protein HL653_21000 [Sphingomonas sp. AP4-R1]